MAKPTDVLPAVKPLTLARVLNEIRESKRAEQDAKRVQDGYRITLANDLAVEVSQFAAENNILTDNDAVEENIYTFDSVGGSAFIKAISEDEFEVSSDGSQYDGCKKRDMYIFVLRTLGYKI